jgi:eukaryotic-like serine/threonine-protein kinase
MNSPRWKEVKEALNAVLEMTPKERSVYLDRMLESDPDLCHEVQSLLMANREAGSFLEAGLPGQSLRLSPGTQIGAYEVTVLIAVGGMGEVYCAYDARLHRKVAIKVLPQEFSADAERLRRFELEARAVAALNHANILAIYDTGIYDASPFMVTELLEGKTLREHLKDGKLAIDVALGYALEIAAGLAAAHGKGIVHRDLKPENLFVTDQDHIKILDFGLAKLSTAREGAAAAGTTETRAGVVLGTTSYMSPEQIRGQPVDPRTDVWSWGVVLYEMIAGHRPFEGASAADVVAAILDRDPEPPSANRHLNDVVLTALCKQPEQRYQMMAEVVALVRAAPAASAKSRSKSRRVLTPLSIRAALSLFAAAVLLLAALSALYFRSRPAHLSENDVIVLADFTNNTGESVFDSTLREALSIDLAQSPLLYVLTDLQTTQTLKLMGRAPGDRITQDVGREICLRSSSKAVLTGSITRLGDHYVLQLRATNCQTGETLAAARAEADSRENVLHALDQAASSLRSRLGESLASVQEYDLPLAKVTTSSLEALQAFSEGRRLLRQGGLPAAAPFLKHALEIDPDFASAHLAFGMVQMGQGRVNEGIEHFRRAYALRDRVEGPEKYRISANYYAQVTYELPKAIAELQLLIRQYPQYSSRKPADPGATSPRTMMAAYYKRLGEWEEAGRQLRDQMRLQPEEYGEYTSLAGVYMALNRLDEAQAALDQAAPHRDNQALHSTQYDLAFLKNDAAGMQQYLNWARGKKSFESGALEKEAATQAYYGHMKKARQLWQAALAAAKHDAPEQVVALQLAGALQEAEFGNPLSPKAARAAVAASHNIATRLDASLMMAYLGDNNASEALISGLLRDMPLSTQHQYLYAPTIRAQIELNRGHPRRAIELLQVTTPYELSWSWWMYTPLVRGKAYLALGDGATAAAEFQKILDHRGIAMNTPRGVLAHLYLGRARAMEARSLRGPAAANAKAAARAAYQDFLTLWKDADPDVPILLGARAEYAKLE